MLRISHPQARNGHREVFNMLLDRFRTGFTWTTFGHSLNYNQQEISDDS